MLRLLLAVCTAFAWGYAHADTWTLLLPAVSHHTTMDGARLATPDTAENRCAPGALGSLPPPEWLGPVIIDDSLKQGCTSRRVPGTRVWQEWNPAIGIERERGTRRDFAMFLVDSYQEPGIMAGSAWMPWRMDGHGYRLDVGLAGGLWWRTTLRDVPATEKLWFCTYQSGTTCAAKTIETVKNGLDRVLVPYLMPVISLRPAGAAGGFGLYFSAIPRLSIAGTPVVPTSTYMLQLTYTFSRSAD